MLCVLGVYLVFVLLFPGTGRLEILYNGTWSTVCDDGFNSAAIQVACRMLGFNSLNVQFVGSGVYGMGKETILIDDVQCKGTETSLAKCSHNPYYNHNCKHNEDVGVICNTQGVQLSARLVNGTQWSGRLEILFKRKWSTVCDDHFENVDAQVACRMLGFNSPGAVAVSSDMYGAGKGSILLDDVNCRGTETNLNQCRHPGYYNHNCGHHKDIGVICNIPGQLTARLVNGTNYSGRLEILYNGTWSTVCDDGFDTAAAQVACRMLGFNSSNSLAVTQAGYGAGQGTILLDETNCTGTETSLAQCSHNKYYTHDCQHNEDVGVVCSTSKGSQLKARLVNGTQWSGRLEILYNGVWSTVCDDDFENVDAQAACRMLGFNSPGAVTVSPNVYGAGDGSILLGEVKCLGTETNLEQCAHPGYYRHNCDHQEDIGIICNIPGHLTARLVNGTNYSGRLEILYNGTWSTVCDDGFNTAAAQVACRMLGFNSSNPLVMSHAEFGEGQGTILLDKVRCTGTEISLAQCSHRGYYTHKCEHYEDVGVICNTSLGLKLKARLVNGTEWSGRLEILYNGMWSTVCDDQFSNLDAQVVCRMLGFNSFGAVATFSNMYGAGEGSILLSEVKCRGTEINLEQCAHAGYYRHHCVHKNDIGIICNIPGQLTASLVNGTDYSGRLEILYNGMWSTVCDDGFDTAAAQVACRMLGFNSSNPLAVSHAAYGAGYGTILLDDVHCTGTETSLAQCSHNKYYTTSCHHSEDVGVVCSTSKDSQLKARLVNGTEWSGRLEILYNGTWSTVCDDHFHNVDAQVVCRMLGLNSPGAVAVLSNMYGAGEGSILLSEVQCLGTETNLEQCAHPGYYRHNCVHKNDIGIICNIPGQLTARLVNGTDMAGRLEILYNGTWSTVCDDGFEPVDAQVACRMLGFTSASAFVVGSGVYGVGQGTILLDDVNCTGTETSLAQCSHRGYYSHNCEHGEDVGVVCKTSLGSQLKARLVNGTRWAGRLEILYNGTWSTVCDDHFENVDAQVACRMLGFNSPGAIAVLSNMYGAGEGSILLKNVDCLGTETSFDQCAHLGYYRHNCVHQEDIGIICNIPGQLTARLVNGTHRAGRLEILYNGTWSTVCDDGFDTADAQVACRMLGFNSSRAVAQGSAAYGAGTGTILLDEVNCTGTETNLAQCGHPGYYTHNCQHNQDVSVICN